MYIPKQICAGHTSRPVGRVFSRTLVREGFHALVFVLSASISSHSPSYTDDIICTSWATCSFVGMNKALQPFLTPPVSFAVPSAWCGTTTFDRGGMRHDSVPVASEYACCTATVDRGGTRRSA